MRRDLARISSAIVLVLSLALSWGQDATAQTAPVKKDGYVLHTLMWRGERVRVLTFRSRDMLKLVPIPSHGYRRLAVPSWDGTKAGAVAATNGQFRIPGQTKPKGETRINGNLVAPGNGTGWVLSMSEDGKQAAITKRTATDWAYQSFGGWPQVVKDGVNTGKDYPYDGSPCKKFKDGCHDAAMTDYNPRTAVGISEGCSDAASLTPCRYYLVVADGRQPPPAEGLRFPALGALMKHIGAYDAMNLDGGGSTVMWVRHRSDACVRRERRGCLVNRVSASNTHPTTGERSVIDAIGVVPYSG